jgi:hypothetical protein
MTIDYCDTTEEIMSFTSHEAEQQGPFYIYLVSIQCTDPQDILDLARYLREDPSGRFSELAVSLEAAVGQGQD